MSPESFLSTGSLKVSTFCTTNRCACFSIRTHTSCTPVGFLKNGPNCSVDLFREPPSDQQSAESSHGTISNKQEGAFWREQWHSGHLTTSQESSRASALGLQRFLLTNSVDKQKRETARSPSFVSPA